MFFAGLAPPIPYNQALTLVRGGEFVNNCRQTRCRPIRRPGFAQMGVQVVDCKEEKKPAVAQWGSRQGCETITSLASMYAKAMRRTVG